MKYDEYKKMCRKAWIEKVNYLCFDKTKNELFVNIVFSMKAKTHILNVFVKVKLCHCHKCWLQLKKEKIWKIWKS